MKLTIHGRNLNVTDAIESYVNKKIGRLNRHLPSLNEARVEVSREQTGQSKQRYTVQVTLYDRGGTILRAEERTPELSSAVDLVADKMHRQIGRFKGKRKRMRKGRSNQMPSNDMWTEDGSFDSEEEEKPDVVRVKRFVISPMNVEEAIEQMELLAHSFFVYFDMDEGAVNVVYRRHDGNYGLIIPELA
ncbi:MAG: ribosome hibernation-promoting factor, HPF/YfiA family [Ardenticatenaceae bacterium]